jgi:6-methylsalicylate decarboxylase
MIVDVHAHTYPKPYFDHLTRLGTAGAQRPDTLQERMALMDEAGVARQVLSPTQPPYSHALDDALLGARLANDSFAEVAASRPDRLSFYVSLPLPHVQESLAEIERGFDELGAAGVVLGTFCLDQTVARDEFEPIWQELNRRKAVVFFHPCQNAICSHLVKDFGLTVCAGASMEDAVTAMHLIGKQIPIRYPDIKFIVPHFGGPLAMLTNRLDGQMPQQGFAEKPSLTARRLFYDTVGWGSKGALLAAIESYGPSQLVTGSDYPILVPWEGYRQTFQHIVEAGIDPEAADGILNRNAARLFGFL